MTTPELILGKGKLPVLAFLGPEGTYSHQVAHANFAASVEYSPSASIADVYHSVGDTIPLGLLPQENSIYGAVTETYDLLRSADLGKAKWIRGAVVLPVSHCLLARKGQKLSEIKTVLSHEQALGQCSKFLSTHLPDAKLVNVSSTALAAQKLSLPLDAGPSSPDSKVNAMECAVIASKFCETIFDELEVLHEGIQNEEDNYTRFYVLANHPNSPIPLISNANHENSRGSRHALVRITVGPIEHSPTAKSETSPSISECLAMLPHAVTRVDRRSSIQPVPFQDVYFVELLERLDNLDIGDGDGSDSLEKDGESRWAKRVQDGVRRVNDGGGCAEMLGIW